MFTQGYFIDSQICIAILWILYMGLLRRHMSYGLARAYLLSIVPVGLLLPLIKLPLLPALAPAVTTLVAMQPLATEMVDYATAATQVENSTPAYVWIYMGVALTMFVLIATQILCLYFKHIKHAGREVVFVNSGSPTAYAIFGTIYVDKRWEHSPLLDLILTHERRHIQRGHSIDLLLIGLCRCVLWFNPLVWHIGTLLREVHEFEADNAVLEGNHSLENYLSLLLKTESGIASSIKGSLSIVNKFSYSLTKKRLVMIAQPKHRGALRLLLALPTVGLMLVSFSLTAQEVAPALPVNTSSNSAKIIVDSSTRSISYGRVIDDVISAAPADHKPLFVVDGAEVTEEYIRQIDSAKVRSLTTLEGDAAKRVFGDKAAGGAVVVTLIADNQDLPLDVENTYADKQISSAVNMVDSQDRKPIFILDNTDIKREKVMQLKGEDIANITVLKGETAKRLYGDKAAGGVVVITLKSNSIKADTSRRGNTNSQPQPISVQYEHKFDTLVSVSNMAEGQERKPIFILDGAEVTMEQVRKLKSKDIANVTVLKGGAAKKLYGERAVDGVAVIDSKK